MEIKNYKIIQDNFIPAVEWLLVREMPAKKCLELSAAYDELVTQANTLQRAKSAIIIRHATKDNNLENVKHDEKGEIIFPSSKAEEDCKREINEIMNESFEVAITGRIKIYDDEKVTAQRLGLLSDIVDVVERDQ